MLSSRLSSIVGREQESEPDSDDDDSLPRLKNDFWLDSRRSIVIQLGFRCDFWIVCVDYLVSELEN